MPARGWRAKLEERVKMKLRLTGLLLTDGNEVLAEALSFKRVGFVAEFEIVVGDNP